MASGSRITDAILGKGSAYAGHSPAINLAHGGQNGPMARIGVVGTDGKNYAEWISNGAYIRRNVIPIVLSYPKFFDLMPDKDKLIEGYKAMIELLPLSFDGLSSGLTVETDEHPVGGAGEMQEEITNVTRARSTLSFTYKDKQGKAIQKFLDLIIRYGYMDPDVKKPLVTQFITDISKVGGMYSADYYTGTVIFIEPDITQKVVVDAWLCTNMFFKSNGDRTGKRDIHSANEVPEYSIESACITMNNEAVFTLADKILTSLTVLNKLPDTGIAVPSNEVDATIAASKTGFNS
jgi:hypothetical protein